MTDEPTKQPTPHQAELAARVAGDTYINNDLRLLGEEVLRVYFSTNRSDKRDAEMLPHPLPHSREASALE